MYGDDSITKNLPIGRDNFKDIIERNLYYVDKTHMIEELLKTYSYVSLFPRPRRFGKSLLISMINNFFNIEYKDINKNLFDGLKISKSKYYDRLSSNPVIKLDFKFLKQDSFEVVYVVYKEMIRELYSNKRFLLDILNDDEKELYNSFLYRNATIGDYQKAINTMCAKLPNAEVRELFNIILLEILSENYRIEFSMIEKFCDGILTNDKELIQLSLNRMLPNISYMDSSESFYHGYLLGLFLCF